jgi:hypothetical protein
MADVLIRVACDVVSGLIPGQPFENDEVPARRFVITSSEWNAADDTTKAMLLSDLAGKASAWATYLMLQPNQLNWVGLDWVWF